MSGAPASALRRALFRLLQSLFVIWAAATIAFVLLRVAPGDPFTARLDAAQIPAEVRAERTASRGLDAPMHVLYVHWLRDLTRGNLGWSFMQQRPVSDVLRDVLPNTLLLMSLALASSLGFGMMLGAWQGTRTGTTGDQLASTGSLVAYSMPEFWLALLLMQLFAQWLGWFPSSGAASATHDLMPFTERVGDRLWHLVLPWLTLTIVGTALFARFQRSVVREAWHEPFVRTARAKGLRDGAVRRHAWRVALPPMMTLFGLVFPALLGGAAFVERIYGWPGMGDATIRAVNARDYDFVTAAVIVGAAMTVVGSLIADWLTQLTDPRTRN
jgi:peptide/nickel transport system permease protein